jgi:hypothetical protein
MIKLNFLFIMAHPKPRLLSINGWNVLDFHFLKLEAHRAGLKTYHLPDSELINRLLNPWSGKPPNNYYLENYLKPRKPSRNSERLCQVYSNCAVNDILSHYYKPSSNLIPHRDLLRSFCEKESSPYEYYEVSILTQAYLDKMIPCPIDPKEWYKFTVFASDYSLREKMSENDLGKHSKIGERTRNWAKMLGTRFPDYALFQDHLDMINYRFSQSRESIEAMKTVIKSGDTAIKGWRRLIPQAGKTEIHDANHPDNFNLRQCWFCGEFYLSPRSQNNNYSRYCADEKCKKSHKAWVTYLDRQGESPASLGL